MIKKFDKTALLILDGWGHGPDPNVNAIDQAPTPFMDKLYQQYPNSELETSGEAVGLPLGQMGNSEVGHLNIGAGRIVYQELVRINKAAKDHSLHQNPVLLEALQYAKKENKKVHLMGLVSDGGVHAHLNHLIALCEATQEHNLQQVFIHAFMDGRDTSPTGGIGYLQQLQKKLQDTPIQIASIIGRYYAMDRDNRWERIRLAYDLLTQGKGKKIAAPIQALQASYDKGVTDEFVQPISCVEDGHITTGDVLICFNFRTDRCRQISIALTQKALSEHAMQPLDIHYCTMTRYDDDFQGIHVLFEKEDLPNTLGEVLQKAGKTQLRIAETEKYPHVTFFFNGGREEAFDKEKRIIIPSPKVATYDLQPEMSAQGVTDAVIKEIETDAPDFICLNYANADMVGHTGIFEAAMKAATTVDNNVSQLVPLLLKYNYGIIIIADHGNSDYMKNPDGTPHTAHTTNPVPCIFVSNNTEGISVKDGKLADVAPTILQLMHLQPSKEMNGDVLVTNVT